MCTLTINKIIMNTDLKSFSSSHWKSILAIVAATVVTVAVVYSLQAAPVPVLKKKSNKKKRSSLKKVDSVVDVAAPGDTPVEPAVAEKIQEPVPNDQLALVAKAAGNELFSSKNYEEAIVQYSTAISLSPNAIFYCNRAACYSNLGQFESARSDCTEAIKLDSKYIKAFRRKALACESLGDTRAALNEYTAVCALEGFKNKSSMAAPDRLLQVLANDRTKLIMVSKVHSVPSETFVSAYMDSFRATPLDSTIVLALSTAEFASDELLKQTFNSALNRKWQASLESCHEALEVGLFSSDLIKAKALNYRGTIRFLMGQIDEAVQDLEDSLLLDSNSVNSLIKRATLYMEHGDLEKTIEQLSKAEEVNSENPDLYYHRGQVRFLTGDFQGAIDDYRKSVTCEKAEEASVYVHIQMGVALYKLGDVVGAEKKFREAKKNFAESAEVWNYHGEILMDRQSYIDGTLTL